MRGQIEGGDALTAEETSQVEAARSGAAADTPAPNGADTPQPDTPAPQERHPAAETTGAEDAPPSDTPDENRNRTVPHQALHEERKLRQDAEARAQEDRRRAQTLEERMNLLLQRMTPPEQQQPAQDQTPIPALEQDPVGHIMARLEQGFKQRDQVLAALAQHVTGQTQQSQQQQAVHQLVSRAATAEREFAAKTPDYQQAYEFVLDGRKRELQAAGWTDQNEIDKFISREAMQLANHAFQVGRNPSELLYDLAKIRGYRPNGQAATAATATQIDTIARGQSQARGINRVPGEGGGAVNATIVANMSDDEFAKWAQTTGPGEKRRIMGGR